MKNKNVGILIIGIAIVLGVIVYLFNSGMTQIVSTSCSHGPSCEMYGTIKTQTYVALALVIIILVIGLVLMFTKEETKIITKKIIQKNSEHRNEIKKVDTSQLNIDEKRLIGLISEANGSIFQSELVEKSGFDKVKVTRILDKLEGRQLIERKRRGMTNVVILK